MTPAMPVRRPLVLGHRGASATHPENTLESFAAARAMGADGVELDVRRTADRRLAVHHDAHLPDGRLIAETRSADLPATVPDLATVLDACHGLLVNIEIKNNPDDADHDPDEWVPIAVGELLAARAAAASAEDPADDVLLSSFSPASLAAVRSTASSAPTARLTALLTNAAATLAAAAAAGHAAVHPWDPTVDAALVDAAHAAGLRVNVWTVNDPARLAELARLGVDGVCTDVPDVAVAAFAAR